MSTLYYESSFAHHGVKGQKWGVRRYQNPDGTLTKAGKVHQMNKEASEERGRKIAADKTKHFGSDVAKVAGVNIGASAIREGLHGAQRGFREIGLDNIVSKWGDTPEMEITRGLLRNASDIGMSVVRNAVDALNAGQVIYNAVKGVKMAKDIYDYHNYKKSKTS